MFSKALALEAALLCQRAYASLTVESKETDTQVLIENHADGLAIAFRGTFNTEGWLRDLDIQKTTCEGMRLHNGFLQDVLSILPKIDCEIPSRSTPLYITGHSKGGGEAIVCGLLLRINGFNVKQVYTFGQPRVGNFAFRQKYNELLGAVTTRVTHAADVVPWIPSFNYFHEKGEAYLPSIGGVIESPTMMQKLTANGAEIAMEYLKRKCGLDSLHIDHAIGNYIAAIQAL